MGFSAKNFNSPCLCRLTLFCCWVTDCQPSWPRFQWTSPGKQHPSSQVGVAQGLLLSMPIMWCNKSKRAKKLSLSLSKMQVGSWSESQHMITASATDCRQLTDACLDYQVETKGNMLKKTHTQISMLWSVLSCFFWFLLCSVWTNKGGIKVSLHWGDSVEFLCENGYYLQTRKSGGKQCCHTSDFFAISSDFSDSSNDSISKKQLVMNLVTSSGVMGDFARLWHE